MKRRIIAMLLVVVMLVLALTGCGYSYAKDDMKQYASFDKDAFLAALSDLKITDAEFTTDETVRATKVLDSIYEALAKAVDADEKVTTGTPGTYDVLYYVYYCTGVKDGTTYTFYANKMKESGASKLQLGLSDLADVSDKIDEAIKNLGAIDDYAYKTKTEGKTAAGDSVYISYTRKYTVETNDGGSQTTTETYSYVKLDIGTAEGTAFADKLIGKDIGQEFSLEKITIPEQINGKEEQVSYSGITIHWVVESGAEIPTFTYTPHTTSTKVAPAENYTADSGKIDLKDVELTYHVFPVYYNEVSDFNATSVLKDVFGTNLSTGSLEMFSEDEYKTLIEELATLLNELSDLEKKLDEATETYEKKKKIVDDAGDGATENQKTAMNNAKTAMDEAQTKVEEKSGKVDEKITAVLAVDTDTSGENNLDTAGRIIDEYKHNVYDSLENAYNNEIRYALATKIYNLIEAIEVTSYPKKAVNEAYDILINSYKATFYTGTDSTSKKTNYALYNGDFKAFLVEQTSSADYAGAKAAVRKEAEAAVKPIVQIYLAAQILDLVYTDKEYNDDVKNTNLGTYEEYYGKVNIKTAEQIDKILNYYLEIKEDAIEEDDHGHEGKITYENGKLPFERVSYTIVEDDAVTE